MGADLLTTDYRRAIVEPMQITQIPGVSTSYKKAGVYVAAVYSNDGHWYAVDADGEDLDGGWRLDTQAEAERVAEAHARAIA